MGKGDGKTSRNLGLIALAAAVVVMLIIAASFWPDSSDSGQQAEVVPHEGESLVPSQATALPTQTVEPYRLPPLQARYRKEDVLESDSTYALWEMVVDSNGVSHASLTDYQLHQGNVVVVTGSTTLFWYEGWFLPIHVYWGGVYTEGRDWFVSNDADLSHTTLGDRPIPDCPVGGTVLAEDNVAIYKTPGGEPIGYDLYGGRLPLQGGKAATVLEGPTIGPDIDADRGTRYWCRVHSEETGWEGWVSPEFEKIDQNTEASPDTAHQAAPPKPIF